MDRRHFISGTLAVAVVAALAPKAVWARLEEGAVERIHKSRAAWQQILTKEQFQVLRLAATERAGSSPLDKLYAEGEYHCAGCDLPLFESSKKFDSGTGWPSFWAPIENRVATQTDYQLIWPRTEYHCARCEGHQGHIFNDGPAPTGKRYCNNGVALRFVPKG